MPVNVNPSTMRKMTGDISVIASYRRTEGTLEPPARFIPHGLPPGIPTDSALEVVSQLESMNLLDSSSITDAMQAIWSMDLATKLRRLLLPTWSYRRQRRCKNWDPTLLDKPSSLSLTELFAPPEWTRSCWMVNRCRRQWTP
uniref:Uncharacterized protein n=1 Tax=Romanomermis culicivorax TaxID=13658 RepID=A0A915HX14_ROMCU